ncbi:efflux RND transporter permease subunit [Pseudomonadota bacterium]
MDEFLKSIITKSQVIIFLLLILLFLGISSYINIPKEDDPNIKIPIALINMYYEGISPEDGSRLLIKPIENELKDLEGVDKITSYAMQDTAFIIVEFNAGYDINDSINKVKNKVDDAKSNLPSDMRNDPIIEEINLSKFPILNILITANIEERQLINIARDLQNKIEGIASVLEVNIVGDREDIIEIEVDPIAMESYNLSLNTIYDFVKNNNILVAAGAIETKSGKYAIKVPGLIENVSDIINLPIKTDGRGVIKVSDIAKIKRSYKDRQNYARINGKPGIALEVVKRSGANIIETVEKVKQSIDSEKESLPDIINITYSNDSSKYIKDFLSNLQNNILFSIFLVLIVVMAVIGISSGVLIAISIPLSFLMGVFLINLMGYTLNIVVLFSLILSIGLLVDNAIVIVEYAELKMREGYKCSEAFLLSVKDMSGALISSTATTIIVFTPLLFWPGVVGEFMKFLPITLICVLGSSLVTALIFLPTASMFFGKFLFKNHNEIKKDIKEIEILIYNEYISNLRKYPKKFAIALEKTLKYPKKIVAVIISSMFIVYTIYGLFGTGIIFFPKREPDNAKINIRARGNLSIDEKDAIVKEIETNILDLTDDVKIFYSKSGNVGSVSDSEDLIGSINIEYHDWKYRRKSREVLKDIKKRTKDLYGVVVETEEKIAGPSSSKPVQIEVKSENNNLINETVEKILNYMKSDGNFQDIIDDRSIPAIEWRLDINREEAIKNGVSIAEIGAIINMVTNGIVIASYRPDDLDEEVDIIIRFPEEKRNLDELQRLKVKGIPVSNFIKRSPQPSISKIKRVNYERTITIESDVKRGVLASTKIQELAQWLKMEANIDKNVTISFAGEEKDKKETGMFLIKAFVCAILGMLVILLIQFNSFYKVGIIVSAIILSTVGVFLGLLVTGRPFSIVMSGIGIIALAGVVVNNNIILIDTYDKFKNMGIDAKEAVIKATTQRLGPILLTSITTILGLFPMIVGANINFVTREIHFGSPSSQIWTQLSTTIAGGIAFTTVLTLVLTPALILLGEKKDFIARKNLNKVE